MAKVNLNQGLFISKIVPLARLSEQKHKIPASVTIAQAILESAWGKSDLALRANNLFGIKGDYNGQSVRKQTMEWRNGKFIRVSARFRKYPSFRKSIEDHSEFLLKKRYGKAFETTNADNFAKKIHRAGYATDPGYSDKLIRVMNDYNLYQYNNKEGKIMPTKTGIILHWTAGRRDNINRIEKKDYHGAIVMKDGKAIYVKLNDYTENLGHCWQRNTNTIGIAVCGMLGAESKNWRDHGILPAQIKEMVRAVAEIAFLKKIDTSKIITHAEAAIEDNYWGDKWDLARLNPGKITPKLAIETGSKLRKSIRDIKLKLMDGKKKVRKVHYENRRKGELIK